MKITDLLANSGRPVAYYPALRALAGSVNAAILLCQLLYWRGKQLDPQGWISKRLRLVADDPDGRSNPLNQSLQRETGLTYKELRVARRLLRERGFLRERPKRLQHIVLFQVDLEAVCQAWNATAVNNVPKGHLGRAHRSLREGREGPSLKGTYIDHPQTTTEEPQSPLTYAAETTSVPEPIPNLPTAAREAPQSPEIQIFRAVCGRVPGAHDYAAVIESIRHVCTLQGEHTLEYLAPFWQAWSSRRRRDGRPYHPASLAWLTEWAVNGSIPAAGQGKPRHSQSPPEPTGAGLPRLTQSDLNAAELINQRRRPILPQV
ncbi:MAG TPA: hypothetical protein VLL49_04180 [Anaerolineales bacterium]|nr:hypothetical protein [Anaerolineales bacterium]